MYTSKDHTNYKIDIDRLKDAREVLRQKKRTPEQDRELLFLNNFIDNEDLVNSIILAKTDFQKSYRVDYQLLFNEYFDYLKYVFEFYEKSGDDLEFKPYEVIVDSYEEVFTAVHDFFKDLDSEWFKLFNNIYKDRFSSVVFSDSRSYSLLFPESNIWIANINSTGTIEDYVNTTHEFAHGIADQICGRVKSYSPNNVLLEMFPIMCQLLFLYTNKKFRNQIEVNNCMTNYLKIMLDYAEEVKFKYNIAHHFNNVSNARNLSRLIKKTWGVNMTKQDVLSSYNHTVAENICYVFPYLVAMDLINLYSQDKDLFKYKVNKILSSNDHPLELINKLSIVPNRML